MAASFVPPALGRRQERCVARERARAARESLTALDLWEDEVIAVRLEQVDAGIYFGGEVGNDQNINHFYWDINMYTNGPGSPVPSADHDSPSQRAMLSVTSPGAVENPMPSASSAVNHTHSPWPVPDAVRSLWHYTYAVYRFHSGLTNSDGNHHPWESKPWPTRSTRPSTR